MLEVHDLTCRRGDRILFEAVSFSVSPGTVLWVTGSNGSGKTTLLRALCGMLTVDRGTIVWYGRDISELRQQYVQQLAYVGHRNALKDDLTPIENLRLTSIIIGQAVPLEAAHAALDAVGIDRPVHLLPTKFLSEGQRRRVALARLWCCETPLWVLDEPFTALDAQATATLRERMSAHVRTGGLLVMSTHQKVSLEAGSTGCLRLGA